MRDALWAVHRALTQEITGIVGGFPRHRGGIRQNFKVSVVQHTAELWFPQPLCEHLAQSPQRQSGGVLGDGDTESEWKQAYALGIAQVLLNKSGKLVFIGVLLKFVGSAVDGHTASWAS